MTIPALRIFHDIRLTAEHTRILAIEIAAVSAYFPPIGYIILSAYTTKLISLLSRPGSNRLGYDLLYGTGVLYTYNTVCLPVYLTTILVFNCVVNRNFS